MDIDSRGVSFALSPALTNTNYRGVCLVLDTLRYSFHPPALQFQPQPLTDTTIVARAGGGSPIVLGASFQSERGGRVDVGVRRTNPTTSAAGTTSSDWGGSAYGINGEGKLEVCLPSAQLAAGVTYERLVISSSSPIRVEKIEEHAYNSPR